MGGYLGGLNGQSSCSWHWHCAQTPADSPTMWTSENQIMKPWPYSVHLLIIAAWSELPGQQTSWGKTDVSIFDIEWCYYIEWCTFELWWIILLVSPQGSCCIIFVIPSSLFCVFHFVPHFFSVTGVDAHWPSPSLSEPERAVTWA